MELKKAARKQVKLKLNLSAPSGAGKTYGALLMALGLVGDWDKIALIDTENGSASLYDHLGPFNVIDLQPPFSPERYIQAIDTCIAGGMECIIIDSSSHEWNGPGGCIEINERLAIAKYRGNTWSAWNETTPRHDKFITKVLQAPVHIVTCTRSKTETVMGDDKKVKKVGMKDLQREGWEYELTVSLTIDRDSHLAIASKDRTNIFEGREPFMITEETGREIKAWCEKGIHVPVLENKADMNDVQFAQLLVRLEAGELDIVEKAKDTFNLSQGQLNQAENLIKAMNGVTQEYSEHPDPTTPTEPVLYPITDKMFGQLLEKVKSGDKECISKAKAAYTFTDVQKEELNNAVKALKVVAKGPEPAESATGALPLIKEAEFRALMKQFKTGDLNVLKEARKVNSFSKANEDYINKIIVSQNKKAA